MKRCPETTICWKKHWDGPPRIFFKGKMTFQNNVPVLWYIMQKYLSTKQSTFILKTHMYNQIYKFVTVYSCIFQLTRTTHLSKIQKQNYKMFQQVKQQVSILRQKKNSPWRHSTTYLGLPAFSFNSFSMFLSKVSAVCKDTFGPTGIATSCGKNQRSEVHFVSSFRLTPGRATTWPPPVGQY